MRKKYLSTIKRAKERGLEFNLSLDYFKQLKSDDCCYCGTPNMFLAHYCEVMGLKTPWMSIDRKDNSKGYIVGNVVSACFVCNRIKSNFFSFEEMLEIGRLHVKPKMEKFKKEAIENYEDWCDQNVFTAEDFIFED